MMKSGTGFPEKLIVHCCYHKVGTVWFSSILSAVAKMFDINFQMCTQEKLLPETKVFLENHSKVDLSMLPPYVGSHLIRDPRDVIISRYFYHLWCKEKWCTKRRYWLFGESYQSRLKNLPRDEGISVEIRRIRGMIKNLSMWDFKNPNMIELRYEELIPNEREGFLRVFKHYGFDDEAIKKVMPIVEQYSFQVVAKRSLGEEKKHDHLRKGLPGDWKIFFTKEHKQFFKELYPGALSRLGYEDNDNW